MKAQKGLLLLLVVPLLFQCQNKPLGEERSVREIMAAPALRNSEIIRSPLTAKGPADTSNLARIEFAEPVFDFGEVSEGVIVEHVFTFMNSGRAPLVINQAVSTCGCTVPEWPKEPLAPGAQGSIKVRFNTANKSLSQNKAITITANTFPAETKIYLRGIVRTES